MISIGEIRFNLICGTICGMESSEKKIKVPTTGLYDFERLIIDGRGKYVDKTRLLYELASDADQQRFISRPRRFGKSPVFYVGVNYDPAKRGIDDPLVEPAFRVGC